MPPPEAVCLQFSWRAVGHTDLDGIPDVAAAVGPVGDILLDEGTVGTSDRCR